MRIALSFFVLSSSIFGEMVSADAVAASIQMRDVAISVPIADKDGKMWSMAGHICQPVGVDHPRLIVINHGSPPNPSGRQCGPKVVTAKSRYGLPKQALDVLTGGGRDWRELVSLKFPANTENYRVFFTLLRP
jgi:hypothetical protein